MEWKDVTIDVPGLSTLVETVDLGSAGIDAYATLRKASLSVLKIMATVRDFADNQSEAAQAALSAAQELIPDVLKDPEAHASTHLLHVPVINPYAAIDGPPVIPGGALPDLMLSAILQAPDSANPGGNYRVYKKIIESIFDAQDDDRPYFYGDTEMGALVVVYGATSYPLALRLSMDLLGLMGGAGGMGLPVINIPADEWQTPVPQNVKVRASSWRKTGTNARDRGHPVASIGDSEAATAVHLRWDNPAIVKRFKKNTPLVYRLTSWHVYAKAGEPIKFGDTMADFEVLSAPIPVIDLKKVETRLSGVTSAVILTHLDAAKTYYVSVSYGVEMVDETQPTGAVQVGPRLDTLSEQLRVRVAEQHGYSTYVQGTPPDWVSLKSPVYAVPELRQVYEKVYSFLAVLKRNVTGYTGELNALLDTGESVTDWYAETLDYLAHIAITIQNVIDKIDDATRSVKDSGKGGIWATSFSGPGTKSFFMHQVRQALLDPSTKNAPPFRDDQGALGALVFLVEGKSPADVATLLEPLKAIFGSSAQAPGVSPVQDLSDNVAADASSAGAAGAEGTLEAYEQTLTPQGLGVGTGDEPAPEEKGSLKGADVEDDPC